MSALASSLLRLALSVPLLLSLGGCGDKLTLDNYNRLKSGQTFAEVKQILGEPARCDDVLGLRACRWGDEERGIHVSFVGEKVLVFTAENIK